MSRAIYTWGQTGDVVWIIDEDRPGARSVTNDAEQVVRDLAAAGVDLAASRIVYRDTEGRWDQMLVQDGRLSGFSPIGADSLHGAIAALDARRQKEAQKDAEASAHGAPQLSDQERAEGAARQIRELMAEHQLAGFFALAAPTHCTHALFLDELAGWMRARLEVDASGAVTGVRVRVQDYLDAGLAEPEAKARHQHDLSATITALEFMHEQAAGVSYITRAVLDQLRQHLSWETTGQRVGDAWGPKP